mmetsp:Transcript_102673/g.203832  ORF Transcript_102673/g.203832 Transcript_102673/m.203832 type:complete len:317 (-) Transcript_102673:131-1081(-)
MLFLLSGAVRFHAKPALECAVQSTPRLRLKAKGLAQELQRLQAKDVKKQLHVNEALAQQYVKHLAEFEKQAPVPACCLYDTPLWNALHGSSLDEDDANWANSYIRIFSGLYGLIRPFDAIQPLSLPVSLGTKLTNSKGKFLRDYWADPLAAELEDALKELPLPVIINCSVNEEDAASIDTEKLPAGTHVTTVNFKINDKEAAGIALGEFVRWAMETRAMTTEELLEFKGLISDEGEPIGRPYRVNPKASNETTIVFEQKRADATDGGWSRKLADFDGSRSKFVREVASGKDRYKRTEINKALRKQDKKKKAGTAVY